VIPSASVQGDNLGQEDIDVIKCYTGIPHLPSGSSVELFYTLCQGYEEFSANPLLQVDITLPKRGYTFREATTALQ
jgi:hypothetical protein